MKGPKGRPRLPGLVAAVVVLIVGCGEGTPEAPPAPKLVPVSGVVTLDGGPLAVAVVTFLPVGDGGTLCVGETDEEGRYALSYLGAKGASPGRYKVAVSLLLTPEGEPVGLGARSSLVMPKAMNEATERLPKAISDLGRTTLSAVVPPDGGSFDFKLPGPLLGPEEAKEAPAKAP